MDLNYQQQITSIIATSILLGATFNGIRENGIPWIAKPIKKVDDENAIEQIVDEPSIREIDLGVAKVLHWKGTLFIDARAEEYLEDGFIPGAIANDDMEALSEEIQSLIGFDEGFVIYCSDDDCGSSEDLAYELQDLGYNNILVFKGGWKTWKEAGLEVEYDE